MPTRAEIHEAYLQGEEAVIALFERTIGQLADRVQALEDQRAKNSGRTGQWRSEGIPGRDGGGCSLRRERAARRGQVALGTRGKHGAGDISGSAAQAGQRSPGRQLIAQLFG